MSFASSYDLASNYITYYIYDVIQTSWSWLILHNFHHADIIVIADMLHFYIAWEDSHVVGLLLFVNDSSFRYSQRGEQVRQTLM